MRRWIGALLALLLLPLASCERPNKNRQTEPKTRRTAVITAHSNRLPYEVIVDAYDETGAHEGTHEYVASGRSEYRQTLDYTSGRRIRIRVEVKPPKRQSFTYCRIRDGRATDFDNTKGGASGWRAICELTTSR